MPKPVLCVVGIGYVGLPLAHVFATKRYQVFGYDVSKERVAELRKNYDRTNELTMEQLQSVHIEFTTDPKILQKTDVIIMAIPTPIDEKNLPDLTMLKEASDTVGRHLKKGAIVVYESTVYPGVTEEICGPILEKASGMVCGEDFTLGYSPERINPGDKKHTVDKIMKIVAGQDDRTTDTLCTLYGSIVSAGIHRAPNIKTAEMAKAIENAQRDLNVAYVNEVAILCNALGISTKEVLEAAGTKWNFLPFKPGLVGGHCIGVDPYYLVHKARELGITTHAITAGRVVNDSMAKFVAQRVFSEIPKYSQKPQMLVLGLTFKENIPDTRNSKSFDVIEHLKAMGCLVDAHDPFVGKKEKGDMFLSHPQTYDAIVLLVPHKEYQEIPLERYVKALKPNGVFYDLKSLFSREMFEKGERKYLSL